MDDARGGTVKLSKRRGNVGWVNNSTWLPQDRPPNRLCCRPVAAPGHPSCYLFLVVQSAPGIIPGRLPATLMRRFQASSAEAGRHAFPFDTQAGYCPADALAALFLSLFFASAPCSTVLPIAPAVDNSHWGEGGEGGAALIISVGRHADAIIGIALFTRCANVQCADRLEALMNKAVCCAKLFELLITMKQLNLGIYNGRAL